ncbi:MAG: hypothetical protein ACK5B9_15975 [Flavobacteriia bacterium]|jgi:hypothetical protein
MRFIQSNELNKKKWDELIQNSNYFSYSYFLDAVAKNWGAYVDENYTKGLAVCFNQTMGIKILYPPFLGRCAEMINLSEKEKVEILNQIQKDFKIGDLNLESEIKSGLVCVKKVFQTYNPSLKQNTLSKRMLKKATESNFTIKEADFSKVLKIIYAELSQKVKELTSDNQDRLSNFIKELDFQNKLISLGIFNVNTELDGGLLFFEGKDKITYITGACNADSRNLGGMYMAMNYLIEYATKNNKKVDFGGSNIESIRRFYISIGGEDQEYFSYHWNKAPLWFNFLRSIKKRI